MKKLADELYMLKGFPPNAINVYVAGDVLIDAGTRQAERRILRQIQGVHISAHALTHVHPDHQGSSHAICQRLSIPLWCGEEDVAAMETPGAVVAEKAPSWLRDVQERWWVGAPQLVERALHEGDEVAGFEVLDTPGHTRGHVSFWRESDRVLVAGRRAQQHELLHRHPGAARAAGGVRDRPRAEPQIDSQGRGARARAGALRTRRAAAQPGEAQEVRGRAAGGLTINSFAALGAGC